MEEELEEGEWALGRISINLTAVCMGDGHSLRPGPWSRAGRADESRLLGPQGWGWGPGPLCRLQPREREAGGSGPARAQGGWS